jgi:hypothetical protein
VRFPQDGFFGSDFESAVSFFSPPFFFFRSYKERPENEKLQGRTITFAETITNPGDNVGWGNTLMKSTG